MTPSQVDNRSSFARFFQAEEHQPFSLNGGQPAAILVHGYPGSPAEMRPLGLSLHREGWSAYGPLLPGFGADIDTLPERRYPEWVEEVRRQVAQVSQRHDPVLLIGFSLGAAVALLAAVQQPPDALILLAPFTTLESWLWKTLPLTRRLFPTIRPFRLIKIDFSDPKTRQEMDKFMPGVDWDDPQIRQGVREFALPVAMFDEIRKAGIQALRAADELHLPVLVIQGAQDQLVQPRQTRRLVERLPRLHQYLEVSASHDLPDPTKPAWRMVEAAVLDFARSQGFR